MRRSFRRFSTGFGRFLIEPLESRQLFSVALPGAYVGAHTQSLRTAVTVSSGVLSGMNIHAEAGQSFRAVIGTIAGLGVLPTGYRLHGSINWGDGTAASGASFVRQSNGSIAVLGAHRYSAAGSDTILIVVTAVPPAGSLAPVRLIGRFQSTAKVITPDGGVTLNETAGVSFNATVGFFHSTLSASTMTAVIDWGDGQQSIGKIVALPTAGPVPTFAVVGSHDYATIGSYPVQITVYSSQPSPIVSPAGITPPVILVAQIDSVIDVLPPLPSATA